jgi:hypothetical protein
MLLIDILAKELMDFENGTVLIYEMLLARGIWFFRINHGFKKMKFVHLGV